MIATRKRTPWGLSDDGGERVAEGITFYSTPSHGGYKLDRKRNVLVPAVLRLDGGWYEEDVDYNRVVLAFPDLFKPGQVDNAHHQIKNYYPDAYEAWTGKLLAPGESRAKDERVFRLQHANDWIVISAWGGWHAPVPNGYVGVRATRGGNRGTMNQKLEDSWWLVPAEEYKDYGFGFVIDLKKHMKWEPHA